MKRDFTLSLPIVTLNTGDWYHSSQSTVSTTTNNSPLLTPVTDLGLLSPVHFPSCSDVRCKSFIDIWVRYIPSQWVGVISDVRLSARHFILCEDSKSLNDNQPQSSRQWDHECGNTSCALPCRWHKVYCSGSVVAPCKGCLATEKSVLATEQDQQATHQGPPLVFTVLLRL